VTQSSEQNVIWLTQEAFDKLQAELEHLRGPVRSEIIARISAGETPADDGVVEPGMRVTTRFVGDDETETFLLGAREMAETTEDLEVFSPQSPLGSAIIGSKKGDTVTYEAPNGKKLQVEIVEAVPYVG
jgi:transcription elongation factor GreA